MSEERRLTVQEAAEQLKISKRAMYDLAAPNGPIPCYRFGRTVRFEQEDLDNYRKSCRFISTKQQTAGVSRLTASSPDGESGLRSYFRKAGYDLKPRPTTKKKRTDSTRLQLVEQTAERQ